MDKKVLDIIIPFADSSNELDLTLSSLIDQKEYINNVIVVSSGKFKLTLLKKIEILKKKYEDYLNIKILLDYESKTTPGTARNRGIESSHIDHIAFIDSGMMAHKYWLSSFKFNYEKNFIRVGSTSFKPKKGWATISALLTYGTKDAINTVPGTILERTKCNKFPVSPKYGEDIIWLDQYKSFFNKNPINPAIYTFFSDNPIQTFKKFYNQINEILSYKSSYKSRNNIFTLSIVFIYLSLSLISFFNINISLLLIISYLLLRFLQKNKFLYLFKIEGIISFPLQIITDMIKIFLSIKRLNKI